MAAAAFRQSELAEQKAADMASHDEGFSVDISGFAIDPDRERVLFDKQNECVFMWTNAAGEPIGVVMCYLVHDGKFWLCLTEQRARVRAIRRDPRSCICISSAGTDMGRGKAISYKGTTRIHEHNSPEIAGWFFEAFARRMHRGNDPERIAEITASLDIPERVVFEFTPGKAISYDGDKLAATIPGVTGGFEGMFD
jgi:hypothetical protein